MEVAQISDVPSPFSKRERHIRGAFSFPGGQSAGAPVVRFRPGQRARPWGTPWGTRSRRRKGDHDGNVVTQTSPLARSPLGEVGRPVRTLKWSRSVRRHGRAILIAAIGSGLLLVSAGCGSSASQSSSVPPTKVTVRPSSTGGEPALSMTTLGSPVIKIRY